MDQMEHWEMTAMSIIAVFMVPTRFAPSKSRWGVILLVSILFFAAWSFSRNLISSCEQSSCPCQADVSPLLHPQRPWWAPNAWWDQYRICKATTEWDNRGRIPPEAPMVIGEHQESIPRSGSPCHCKWNLLGFPSLATYDFTIEAMGPWEVWATGYGMGCRMWPAIQRSRKARIHHNDELYTSRRHFTEDSKTRWH